MAHAHLTEYLLVLATDSAQLTQYNNANKEQRDALAKAAGLTTPQSEVLQSADSALIMDEVLKELSGAGDHRQPAYTIQLRLHISPCKKPTG
jgi:hypothetical protein